MFELFGADVNPTHGASPSFTDWLTAVGTVGATVLAVLLAGREILSRLLFHPKLAVSLDRRPPDCHIIQVTEQMSMFDRSLTIGYNVFYCRLRVDNVGNRRAENVGVRMTRLSRFEERSAFVQDADFLPMNLNWAHLGEGLLVPFIDPHLPRHCNLCHVVQPLDERTPAQFVQFDTEVVPNEVGPNRWPTKKPPGRYRLEIAVTAQNAKVVYRTLAVEFSGRWFDNATEMAESGLKVDVTAAKYE